MDRCLNADEDTDPERDPDHREERPRLIEIEMSEGNLFKKMKECQVTIPNVEPHGHSPCTLLHARVGRHPGQTLVHSSTDEARACAPEWASARRLAFPLPGSKG